MSRSCGCHWPQVGRRCSRSRTCSVWCGSLVVSRREFFPAAFTNETYFQSCFGKHLCDRFRDRDLRTPSMYVHTYVTLTSSRGNCLYVQDVCVDFTELPTTENHVRRSVLELQRDVYFTGLPRIACGVHFFLVLVRCRFQTARYTAARGNIRPTNSHNGPTGAFQAVMMIRELIICHCYSE